jgi:hypothetical protein
MSEGVRSVHRSASFLQTPWMLALRLLDAVCVWGEVRFYGMRTPWMAGGLDVDLQATSSRWGQFGQLGAADL